MPTFLYQLHQNPPHIVAKYEGGFTYKVLLDGTTTFLIEGGYEVPAPGCPCPDVLAVAKFWRFVLRHRRSLVLAAFGVVALASLQFLLMFMPGNDELYWSFVNLFSFWMNATLLVAFAFAFAGAAIWNFGKGLHIETRKQQDTPLLNAGQISIHPDIMVASLSPDETTDKFADRMEESRDGQVAGQWVVVLPFRNPVGTIVRNAEDDEIFSGYKFTRDNPPYQSDEWPIEQRICLPGKRFQYETWEEYQAYLRHFATHYPEWALWAKAQIGDPVSSLANAMRAAATCLLLLLAALPAFSQKSAQVERYLGTYRYENDRPKGETKFIFQKGVIRRNADGQKTYKALLPDNPLYKDTDNGGKLIGITVAGQTIAPEPPPSTAPATHGEHREVASLSEAQGVRPVPQNAGKTFWEAVPDSSKLESYKAEMLIAKERFGREMSPRLGFLMWCFLNYLLPLIFLVGGVAYYLAKVAAGESAISLGGFSVFGHNINQIRERATFVVAVCVWTIAVIILTDQLLKAYFFSGSLWWFFIKGVCIIAIAYKLSNWLIPNPRIVSGQTALPHTNQPQLNR